MGYIRVTQQMMVTRVLNDLNMQTRRLFEIGEQMSTGQRVNRPSDDPLSARQCAQPFPAGHRHLPLRPWRAICLVAPGALDYILFTSPSSP